MGLEPTTTGITIRDSTFELRSPSLSSDLACPAGLEPTTPSLEGWCSIRLSYVQPPGTPNPWSVWRGLNTRHLAPKASALPGCATPRKKRQMLLSDYQEGNRGA